VWCCFPQFSMKMEQAQAKFLQMPPASDIDAAQHLLQQHQDIKKSAYILCSSYGSVRVSGSC
jgi:hypothetical protein